MGAGPSDSIDGANVSIVDEENNKPHNQLLKDFAAAVGSVDIQFPPRKTSDSSFDLEWRMSMKKKSRAKSLARGDSFEEIAKDGFSDTDEEDVDEMKTPIRQQSIVGKDNSVQRQIRNLEKIAND